MTDLFPIDPSTAPQLFELPPTHRPKLEVWKERHGVYAYKDALKTGNEVDSLLSDWIAW